MRKRVLGVSDQVPHKQAVQPHKMARGLKFCIKIEEELHYPWAKTKALISFAVTAKLICVFVFAYAKKTVFS